MQKQREVPWKVSHLSFGFHIALAQNIGVRQLPLTDRESIVQRRVLLVVAPRLDLQNLNAGSVLNDEIQLADFR